MKLQTRIEKAITGATAKAAAFSQCGIAAGGCISDSRVVTLTDGRRFFIKTHPSAGHYPGFFRAEFEALQLLSAPGVIRVPAPVAFADEFIVMEHIHLGRPAADWHEKIGRQLAALHRATVQDRFGFVMDNYLGTTPQPNPWMDDWLSFWRDQRLGRQLHLYAAKTVTDDPLLRLGEKLMHRLDEYLGAVDEPAVLLHGDLWSGNAASDERGEPVIYDPASYYGHREAEIGMMRMFGGFGPVCEAAYGEVWPLQPGAEERIRLYRLYHELNHLNLFGRGYYQPSLNTLQSLV